MAEDKDKIEGELPENVLRIECADGSRDYIEIVFDRPFAEIQKEIEEEMRKEQPDLSKRLNVTLKRGKKPPRWLEKMINFFKRR